MHFSALPDIVKNERVGWFLLSELAVASVFCS